MTTFNEQNWIIQLRRILEEENEDDDREDTPVSIFSVSKPLLLTRPESYIPQQVAIGPYHHLRSELYEMERYKIAAARRFRQQITSPKFELLLDQLTKLEYRIRACYHKYIELKSETLALMMAIDASFLVEFLNLYLSEEGNRKMLRRVSSRMAHLMDSEGRKSGHNITLRDIMMLENQIPMFVPRKLFEFQLEDLHSADEALTCLVIAFCREMSPFIIMGEPPKIQVSDCAHLLDFLYNMIINKDQFVLEVGDDKREEERGMKEACFSDKTTFLNRFLSGLGRILLRLSRGILIFAKRVLFSKPVKAILGLPCLIISNLPGFFILKQYLILSKENQRLDADGGVSSSTSNIEKPPLIEEIAIPSVTELAESGIQLSPTNGGISAISFNKATLYLPTVNLDVNTETIMRNLVAYEASDAPGPMVLTRYTELMNGIIDTGADARLLREMGIIVNRLKSDEEVAEMWNGMNRSIRLTKVDFLDKVIEDVNEYYHGRWIVMLEKFMRQYVFESWQLLLLFGALFMLFLTTLQSFCSFYVCSRMFFRAIY